MVSKRALDPKIVAAIVEVVGYQGRGGYRKMTLTSKNSCLPALLLPVPVNLFLDFFLFVFLKQLFTQRVGRDFRPRLEKETLGSFGAGVPLPFNE